MEQCLTQIAKIREFNDKFDLISTEISQIETQEPEPIDLSHMEELDQAVADVREKLQLVRKETDELNTNLKAGKYAKGL